MVQICFTHSFISPNRQTFKTRRLDRIDDGTLLQAMYFSLSHYPELADPFSDPTELDGGAACLTDAITEALDIVAPTQVIAVRPKYRPWCDGEVRALMRRRDSAYRRARRSPTPENVILYRRLRSCARYALERAKTTYFRLNVVGAIGPRESWRVLRDMGISSRPSPSPLSVFDPDVLNRHFAAVSAAVSPLSTEDIELALSTPPAHRFQPFSIGHVSELGVLQALARLKSRGCDKAQHMIYADDTQILITGPSRPIAGLVTAANSEIAAICEWARSNLIRLNSNKTGAMLCGGRFRISSALDGGPPRLFVDGVPIVNSASLKILGCIIAPSLSWNLQMNRVSSSVHHVLHALRHNRHALPHALRQRLVAALVFPYLDYAAPLILDLDAHNSAKLHRLHNSAVRFVFGNIPYNAHVTPYRLALGWLSSRRRCEYIAVLLALKIISTREPRGLAELFTVRERQPDEIVTRSRAVRLVVSSPNTAITSRILLSVVATGNFFVTSLYIIAHYRANMSEREQRILHELIKSREAIRRKALMLKRGRDETERTVTETFKPIIKPLNRLVTLKEEKSPHVNKKKKLEQQTVKPDQNLKVEDSNDESQNDQTLKVKDPEKTLISDDDEHTLMTEDEEELITEDEDEDQRISHYFKLVKDASDDLDKRYGVYMKNDKFYFGKSPISFMGTRVYFGNIKHDVSTGLLELLFKRIPNTDRITENDRSTYKEILEFTNAHRKGFADDGELRRYNSKKFDNIIEPLFKSGKGLSASCKVSKYGRGLLPRYKVAKGHDSWKDFVYWNDPNELVDRLRLLVAERSAGNNAHDNEITSIIEELREDGYIY
ncbi:unnamed protein product [Trichogramma brassicae]|uniref:DUF8207 domain-containing protein n=1 Tax=Trichogramma brassicae TaxID=86971 RepID=A0A6H5IRA0_9HYME|nr:unnamed protein product [Trichogramma brassicae]